MPSLLAVTIALVSLVLPGGLSAAAFEAAAPSQQASSAVQANGPSVVEVPLQSTLEVRPAEGWSFADCDTLLSASELVTNCSPAGFVVTGPAYDADIEPVRVPVLLQSGSRTLTVDYVIRLALPAPPTAPDTKIDLPLAAGAVSLIPLSELGLECGLCSAGVSKIEVRGSAPAAAGVASVTGTHLVFAAAPDARGPVEVDIHVTDDIGTRSNTIRVTVYLSAGPETTFHGLHLVQAPGAVELSAAQLLASERPDELIIAGCESPLRGTVMCTPDGSITYTPPADDEADIGASVDASTESDDQFAVRIVSADGRQALTSVTLLPSSAAALAAGAGAREATLMLSLRTPPPESDEQAGTGVTSGFSDIMDALGAR